MVWELIAIWAIVIATLVWFVRDERARRAHKLDAMARHFALAAAWRHRAEQGMDYRAPRLQGRTFR